MGGHHPAAAGHCVCRQCGGAVHVRQKTRYSIAAFKSDARLICKCTSHNGTIYLYMLLYSVFANDFASLTSCFSRSKPLRLVFYCHHVTCLTLALALCCYFNTLLMFNVWAWLCLLGCTSKRVISFCFLAASLALFSQPRACSPNLGIVNFF